MNILVDRLPEFIRVNGRAEPINSDHRTALSIILDFEDDGLTDREKLYLLIKRLYRGEIAAENADEASREGVRFLNGGRADDAADAGDDGEPMRLYSFEKDAGLIYAAFRQTHGVSLSRETLHWWEFLALFMDLGAETTFANLVGLRKRVKSGKATKEEREAAREMGAAFDVGSEGMAADFDEARNFDAFMAALEGES